MIEDFGKFTGDVGFQVAKDADKNLQKFGQQQANALAWFDGLMAKREDRVNEAVKKLTPGGQVPAEIKTTVKMDLMKGVEAAVKGSAKWQETIARTQMANRFGQQNKHLEAQNKANVILEQIKNFVARPPIMFGIL